MTHPKFKELMDGLESKRKALFAGFGSKLNEASDIKFDRGRIRLQDKYDAFSSDRKRQDRFKKWFGTSN